VIATEAQRKSMCAESGRCALPASICSRLFRCRPFSHILPPYKIAVSTVVAEDLTDLNELMCSLVLQLFENISIARSASLILEQTPILSDVFSRSVCWTFRLLSCIVSSDVVRRPCGSHA
jgi:hypothetical protein